VSVQDLGAGLARMGRGVRWYLRECSGEARWDRYLEDCARHGHPAMSRREYERARSDAKERTPNSRCC
jgi:uncharacterized short protein YbdD (DUF466 family)